MPKTKQSIPENVDGWYEAWVASRDVTPERQRADERRYRKYIAPKFGEMPVQKVTPRLIQNWLASKVWEGREPTKYASLMVLRQVLDLPTQTRVDGVAVLKHNPADGIRLESSPTGIRSRAEEDLLPREAAEEVVEAMDEHYRPLGLLALRLGVTWAEAMGLEISDVDIPNRRIRIGRLLGIETAGQVEVRPRNSEDPPERTIAMPKDLAQALAIYLAESTEIRGNASWVFITPNPGKDGPRRPLRPNWNRYVLRPALEKAGLDPRSATFHTFRHTAARNLLQEGVSMEEVQRMLGHKSLNTTKRYYKSFVPSAA